ncbi:MAG: hypothetical protein JNK63_04515 [Chthonomonas sp.]|nr:hypothetical protein [Chthonomonas sp.]
MHRVQRMESLRPMTSGEILNLTTMAFREIGMAILRPTFSAATLVYVAFMMMTQLILPQMFTTRAPHSVSSQVSEVATTVVLGIFTALPILVIGLSIIITHSVHATADYVSNRWVHEGERQARSDQSLKLTMWLTLRTLVFACSGLLITLFLLLASALLNDIRPDLSAVAGGIAIFSSVVALAIFLYVLVRHSLAPAAALLENAPNHEAPRRSIQLLRTYRGAGSGDDSIVAIGLSLTLLGLCFWGGIEAIYGTLGVIPWLTNVLGRHWWGEIAMSLATGLPYLFAFWVIVPIYSVGTTLVFFERKIRLEGYDISLLHDELRVKR